MSEEKLQKKQKSSTGLCVLLIAIVAGGITVSIVLMVNTFNEATRPITITGTVGTVERKEPQSDGRILWDFTMQDEVSNTVYTIILKTDSSVTISIGTRLSITGVMINPNISKTDLEATSYTIL